MTPIPLATSSPVLVMTNVCVLAGPRARSALTRDPISRLGTTWSASSANRNLYTYAGFNPVNRFDYWGGPEWKRLRQTGSWIGSTEGGAKVAR